MYRGQRTTSGNGLHFLPPLRRVPVHQVNRPTSSWGVSWHLPSHHRSPCMDCICSCSCIWLYVGSENMNTSPHLVGLFCPWAIYEVPLTGNPMCQKSPNENYQLSDTSQQFQNYLPFTQPKFHVWLPSWKLHRSTWRWAATENIVEIPLFAGHHSILNESPH